MNGYNLLFLHCAVTQTVVTLPLTVDFPCVSPLKPFPHEKALYG